MKMKLSKAISSGFTLIELLIVIGVLGIMSAGLLATVDPFEQLKKARDANNRNAAIEAMNAFTRYYATHGKLPWNMSPVSTNCDAGASGVLIGLGGGTGKAYKLTEMNGCVTDTLIADGELKTSFYQGIGQTDFYVYSSSPTNIVVCFAPEGKALINDPNTSYLVGSGAPWNISDDGLAMGAGDACPGTSGCLQCFQ